MQTPPNDPAVELLEAGSFCYQLELPPPGPHTAPAPPVVMVSHGIPPRTGPGIAECSPRNALIAADFLVTYALKRAPGLRASTELASLIDALWPALRDNAYDLIRSGPKASKLLRHYVENEVALRVQEDVLLRREAARLYGLAKSQDLIRRLWDVASEENVAARSVSMAALSAEVRPLL